MSEDSCEQGVAREKPGRPVLSGRICLYRALMKLRFAGYCFLSTSSSTSTSRTLFGSADVAITATLASRSGSKKLVPAHVRHLAPWSHVCWHEMLLEAS